MRSQSASLRDLLKRATAAHERSKPLQAARVLFGVDDEYYGLSPTYLRSQAAALYSLSVTRFRRDPEETIISALADSILEIGDPGHEGPPPLPDSGAEEPVTRDSPFGLRLGYRFGPGDVYEVVHRDGTRGRPDEGMFATPIDSGGAGTVYRVIFAGAQDRAVKFLTSNLSDEDRTGRRVRDFRTTFQKERDILFRISHGNIAHLLDADVLLIDDVPFEYIVMEHVAGPMIAAAVDEPETTGERVFALLTDVLDALVYLHGLGIYHGDVKSENIKLRQIRGQAREAVLLDLGAAHLLEPPERMSDTLPLGSERKLFITTYRLLDPAHLHHVNTLMTDEELGELFPGHDLRSFGVLIEELLEQPLVTEKLQRHIGGSGLLLLRDVQRKLLVSAVPGESTYKNMAEVRRDWEKLEASYVAPAGIPELSLAAEFKYAMPTATGRAIVTARVNRIIQHTLMTRLGKVPQLELTRLKFLGATHTRLSHSTAVYRNASLYVAHLLNDTRFRLMADVPDLEATVLLALLHDVGHYQLSHMFEDFSTDQRIGSASNAWAKIAYDIPGDDDLFRTMLTARDIPGESPRGEYGARLTAALERSREFLRLEHWGAPPASLAEIIEEDFSSETLQRVLTIHGAIYGRPEDARLATPAQLILGAVLSSDIDADKTAYLVEDSQRTGVRYGAGVDTDGILGALRAPAMIDMPVHASPAIGIVSSGLAAAQSVALNRNLMVNQVYWDHSNRAATAMVKYEIARLLVANELDFPQYFEDTLLLDTDVALRWLYDRYRQIAPEQKIVPMAGLMFAERRLYKRILQTNRLKWSEDDVDNLTERLLRLTFAEVVNLEDQLANEVKKLPNFSSLLPGEVLVDVPLKERGRTSGERGGQVLVYPTSSSDGPGVPLGDATPFFRGIKEQHRKMNRICRVFIAPRHARPTEQRQEAGQLVESFLRHHYRR